MLYTVLKTCGKNAKYIYQTMKKLYRKSVLKFTVTRLWNKAQYVEDFKLQKKSTLKMYSNKKYNLEINYARPKILKCTKDICLKRPIKIKACIGSNFRVPN